MKILEKYYEKIGKFETVLETIDFQDGNQWEIVSKTRGEHGYFDQLVKGFFEIVKKEEKEKMVGGKKVSAK